MSEWQEVRDRTRLWCKIDPERCLVEIVHRGIVKVIDLAAYGLAYVRPPEEAEGHLGYVLPQEPGRGREPS